MKVQLPTKLLALLVLANLCFTQSIDPGGDRGVIDIGGGGNNNPPSDCPTRPFATEFKKAKKALKNDWSFGPYGQYGSESVENYNNKFKDLQDDDCIRPVTLAYVFEDVTATGVACPEADLQAFRYKVFALLNFYEYTAGDKVPTQTLVQARLSQNPRTYLPDSQLNDLIQKYEHIKCPGITLKQIVVNQKNFFAAKHADFVNLKELLKKYYECRLQVGNTGSNRDNLPIDRYLPACHAWVRLQNLDKWGIFEIVAATVAPGAEFNRPRQFWGRCVRDTSTGRPLLTSIFNTAKSFTNQAMQQFFDKDRDAKYTQNINGVTQT